MRLLKTILGSAVLLFASNVTVKADIVHAGPLPATDQATIICSAVNMTAAFSLDIQVVLVDANFRAIRGSDFTCPTVTSFGSCSVSTFLGGASTDLGSAVSPFQCVISSPAGGFPVQGSICIGVNPVACLQAHSLPPIP
jgi:hypothetical protein